MNYRPKKSDDDEDLEAVDSASRALFCANSRSNPAFFDFCLFAVTADAVFGVASVVGPDVFCSCSSFGSMLPTIGVNCCFCVVDGCSCAFRKFGARLACGMWVSDTAPHVPQVFFKRLPSLRVRILANPHAPHESGHNMPDFRLCSAARAGDISCCKACVRFCCHFVCMASCSIGGRDVSHDNRRQKKSRCKYLGVRHVSSTLQTASATAVRHYRSSILLS